jgi:glycosyltransferase involved in cell wall biosynthesis
MKVLHIWNTAGVASILAKYQAELLGWNTWVLMRLPYDPFCMTLYGELDTDTRNSFMVRALWILKSVLRSRCYDLIHVHALDKILPILRVLYPQKPIIMHYHGTDIRGKWSERKKYWRNANLILVSTLDLLTTLPREYLQYRRIVYLPNPVDTRLFKSSGQKIPGTALFVYSQKYGYLKWAEKNSQGNGINTNSSEP